MKRWLKLTAWFFLTLALIANGMAFMHARRFIYFDPEAPTKSKEETSFTEKLGILFTGIKNPRPANSNLPELPYEVIRLEESHPFLELWKIQTDSAQGNILLLHGYGGSKSGLLDRVNFFREQKLNVYLLDFAGAGNSEGNLCTIGFQEAGQVKRATQHIHSASSLPLFIYGTSMGAVAAMKYTAEEQPELAGLVLECPYGSLLQSTKNRFKTQGLPPFPLAHLLVFWGGVQAGFNGFDLVPEKYARQIKLPTLLLWGAQDKKVLREETDRIFHHLSGPKRLVIFEAAAHENYRKKYPKLWESEVKGFLQNSSGQP